MKFRAEIEIMPHKELLDPQGRTVAASLKNLHIEGVEEVRIGKHVHMEVEAASENEANEKVDTACKKLLANMIMETYHFDLSPVGE